MKAKDLMIGDWVLHNTYPARVNLIGNTMVKLWNCDNSVDVDDVLPMPITTELLKHTGFKELMNESEVSAARFGRKPEPTEVWQYSFGRFDSVAYVPEQSFLRIKFMEGCQADIANIEYVHELQHALRLCGVEKEIIL